VGAAADAPEAPRGSCEAELKRFNKAVAELGRLIKAGAVNASADAAAGGLGKVATAAQREALAAPAGGQGPCRTRVSS
jgi:hypothetical protein